MFDAKPQHSCFDLSHSGQRGVSLTAPFQIAYLGQSLLLFRPVCGQSHSRASGAKVLQSIILILHCKQTYCILLRCIPDIEISSLSAADKKKEKECFSKWHIFQIAKFFLQQIESPAESKDSKEGYGPCHTMYYAKSCS